MKRFWLPLLLALLSLSSAASAAPPEEEPEVSGRKLSEWIEILRGQRGEVDRKSLSLALGTGASNPAIWQPYFVQQRRLALAAIVVVGAGKSPKVLPAIAAALHDDPDDKMREVAALALGRAAGRLVDDAKDAIRKEPSLPPKPDLKLGSTRDALAIALREDKTPRVREAAAGALGRLEWSAVVAVPALGRAMKDDNAAVRLAAAEALRRIGENASEAIPALQDALKDDKADKLLRSLSAKALGRQSKDANVDLELLLKVWHDTAVPVEIRADVGEALGFLGKTSAASDLGTELANAKNDVVLRRAAAVSLDSFKEDARPAVAALHTAVKDEEKYVRMLAMHALGQIGRGLGDERKGVVKDLVAAISDRVLEVRVAAIETLGVLGPDGLGDDLTAVVERLTVVKGDGPKAVREAADNALKKLGK